MNTRCFNQSVPEMPAQVQKVEDLTDSLRRLKTEGNLLRDRYQSLLERNIIEPRVRVGYVLLVLSWRRTHMILTLILLTLQQTTQVQAQDIREAVLPQLPVDASS